MFIGLMALWMLFMTLLRTRAATELISRLLKAFIFWLKLTFSFSLSSFNPRGVFDVKSAFEANLIWLSKLLLIEWVEVNLTERVSVFNSTMKSFHCLRHRWVTRRRKTALESNTQVLLRLRSKIGSESASDLNLAATWPWTVANGSANFHISPVFARSFFDNLIRKLRLPVSRPYINKQ